LKTLQDGCVRADSVSEEIAARSALKYFHATVGVPVYRVDTGYVSLCGEIFVVPISARTEQAPAPNIWYVDVSKEGYRPLELLRPM
jgi:hypothetical protein